MSIVFIDPGGEYYFGAGMSAAGIWDLAVNCTLVNNAPAGRSTTYAIAVGGSGNGFQKNFPIGSTIAIGAAIYIPANWLNSSPTPIFRFVDSGNSVLIDICANSAGQLCVFRGGVQLGLPGQFVQLANGSGWHFVEAEVFFSSTNTGSVKTWVDGVNFYNNLGIITSPAGNDPFGYRFYVGQNGQPTSYWKDMYIINGSSGVNRTHLGDVAVLVKYHTGNGAHQDWVANTGTAVAAIQDGINHTGTWPDGDTTYISSSTPGQQSDFTHQALTLTGSVYAVMQQIYVRKDDSGSRLIKPLCVSGVTTLQGFDQTVTNTYNYLKVMYETDPNTGSAWTVSGFNNATFGVVESS
jgi:hypothetical protein